MEDEMEEMLPRHHRAAASRNHPHHHRRRAKKAAASGTSYDDVFGGGPRHAAPPFASGVPEDYSEVFGGVSVSCSIPFLDLPATYGGWGDEESGSGNGLDYGEIFGRCEFSDFAVPYEELFGRGRRRMEEEVGEGEEVELHFALDNGRSSFKGRSGPQTTDPSSIFTQNYPTEDAIPYLDDSSFNETPTAYNASYSKSSRTRSKELLHTTTSLPNPQTGFTFIVEPGMLSSPERHQHLPGANEDTATHENDVRINNKPDANTRSVLLSNKEAEEEEESGVPFLDVSDVNFLTKSANLPPPARPPPAKFSVNGRHNKGSNLSTEAEQPQQEKPKKSFLKSDSLPPNFDFVPNLKLDKREKPKLKSRGNNNTFAKSDSLPPGFGSELDAMKQAMEFAQARLKTAKELHERRREGKITELPLRKKSVKEESLEGSEVEKPRILRSISLAANFTESRGFMKVQSGVAAAAQGSIELEKSGKWRSDEEFHELTSIELTKEKECKVESNIDSVHVNELPPTGVTLTRNLNEDVNANVSLEQIGEMKSGEDSKREEETATASHEILNGSKETVTKKEPIIIEKDFSFEFEREREDRDIEALKEYANGIPNVEDVVDIEEIEAESKDGSFVKFGTETEDQNMKEEVEEVTQVEKEVNEEKEKERLHKLEVEEEEEEEMLVQLEDEEERELQMEKEREERERRERERVMAEEEERLERERLEKEEERRVLVEEREREGRLEEERREEKRREKEMLRKLEEERERERKLAEEVRMERERVRKLEEERERERERVRMLEEEKQREREMALKLEKEKEREREMALKLKKEKEREKERERELQEEIERERERVRKLEEEREREREKFRKLEEERELERERFRKLEEEREQERERVRQLEEERERERLEMEQRERERIAKEREQREMERKLEEEREKQRMEKEKEEREKQRRMEKEREEREAAMRLEAEKRRLERKRAEEREKMMKLQGEKAKERKTEARKSDEEREREVRVKERERKPEGRKSDEERERERGRRVIRKERETEEREREEEEEEKERQREREKDRLAMERAEQIAGERIAAARQRAGMAEDVLHVQHGRGAGEGVERKERERMRAERAAVERATAEARERAIEKAKAEADKERLERLMSFNRMASQDNGQESHFKRTQSDSALSQGHGESALRHKARLERQQRTAERAAKALAEKNRRDIMAQREQAERDRISEHLDADVRRWSSGKEGNLRALLSTLQYILGQNSGWQPIHLTEVITAADVKRAYRKATLYVHPDKLQQRGASIQHKYICEKVFDLLKEAWNKFNSEER